MPLFFKSKASTGDRQNVPVATTIPPRSSNSSDSAARAHNTPNGQLHDQGEPIHAVDAAVERTTRDIGVELLNAARSHKAGLLSKAFWSDKLMDWSMKDEAFKIQLFRFVDTFPMLK